MDVKQYLGATKPRTSSKCITCASNTEAVLNAIEFFAKQRAAGKTAIGFTQFWSEFLKPNGFTGSVDSLRRHINRCIEAAK